jgi:hypothetical protein
MFRNEELEEHLNTSSTIKLNSAVIAEWNMNIAENIAQIGNYRYRPTDDTGTKYNPIVNTFDPEDQSARFYTDATDADIVIDGGLTDDGLTPQLFTSKKEKEKLLYSLEDCFGRFRPRSGINKLRYFENNFSHFSNIEMAKRPRYYMADKKDIFKYWTSYRTEDGIERGIASRAIGEENYIDDVSPFVVYKEPVPANRVVVKMQTNVGSLNLGPFGTSSGPLSDPHFGEENKTVPTRWRIQYLEDGTWVDAFSIDQNTVRRNGKPVIDTDGYFEIFYGLIVPEEYLDNFKELGVFTTEDFLPDPAGFPNGSAYLIKTSETQPGTYYVVFNNEYETFTAQYGWSIYDEDISNSVPYVKELTAPPEFVNEQGQAEYREFKYISGLRLVVQTMNKFDSTFDLIELSPRLAVDLSDKTVSYSVNRSASDLGVSGLPVGQLLASVGSLDLFDYDQSFFLENPNSVIAKYTSQNIQIKLYEIIQDVDGKDFYVPIKTMYSEGFPSVESGSRNVSLDLRDLFFYFESLGAPEMLVTDASLSYAVCLLLDYIGFANYVFLRNEDEDEEIIPFFFIEPDKSIAEILESLALSTQTAMFLNEYNDLIVMSRGYIMPTETERPTDIVLRGSKDFQKNGAYNNESTSSELANIIDVSFQDNQVYNDGVIKYTTRYIQRAYPTIRQATNVLDRNKTWAYLPSEIWEVSPQESIRSVNDLLANQSAYVLSALPLNSDLSGSVPEVSSGEIINNTIDFGDGANFLSRFNGYFYSNGEIIRYDAVQFSIPGLSDTSENQDDLIWISNIRQYQSYFSKIPFNGKMYPTGLVRIYSEPNYETIDIVTRLRNGPVAKHGRGQFGTSIVAHTAGINPYWLDNSNISGVNMYVDELFGAPEKEFILPNVRNLNLVTATGGSVSEIDFGGEQYIVHTFSRPGSYSFNVENASTDFEVEYLVVGGGGAGGAGDNEPRPGGGGGGAGGLILGQASINNGNFGLTVGSGGAASSRKGANGGNSTFLSLTAFGGGAGGNNAEDTSLSGNRGENGGSGGGGTRGGPPGTGVSGQGHGGSLPNPIIIAPATGSGQGGSGGGAGGPAILGPNKTTIPGPGISSNITGRSVVYAFGGTGGTNVASSPPGANGLGSGGGGAVAKGNARTSPTFNGTRGGDGTVIIRYKKYTLIDASGTILESDDTSDLRLGYGVVVEEKDPGGLKNVRTATVTEIIDANRFRIDLPVLFPMRNQKLKIIERILTEPGFAGVDKNRANATVRSGLIKTPDAIEFKGEIENNIQVSGTMQSSALVVRGKNTGFLGEANKFISFINKTLDDKFVHFGTRMRIIGKQDNSVFRGQERHQSPNGAGTLRSLTNVGTQNSVTISGSGGGIGTMINLSTGNGYFFEIQAMTERDPDNVDGENVYNVVFYKTQKQFNDIREEAVPVRLWGGVANILTDTGEFAGQSRVYAEENPTVYDMAIEYEQLPSSDTIRFYLYLNDQVIATVDDPQPLPIISNFAIFVRGDSECMFENVYALANNYSKNSKFNLDTPVNSVFGTSELNAYDSFRKYAISGLIQSTYLSGIGSDGPDYNIFYDEFGTIMREADYLNIKYDKAFPALYAKIQPTGNRLKAYTVSGFRAGAYGAEFLVFNNTDTHIILDGTSGNYLRIGGITFTQESQNEYTIDQYFEKYGNLSEPLISSDGVVTSPQKSKELYTDIKLSRITQGKKEFALEVPYIQSHDAAESLMSWLVEKITKPRKSVGIKIFANPTIQLGDIVELDYTNKNGFNEISESGSRFVIYHIEYSRSASGPDMTIYLSEVI